MHQNYLFLSLQHWQKYNHDAVELRACTSSNMFQPSEIFLFICSNKGDWCGCTKHFKTSSMKYIWSQCFIKIKGLNNIERVQPIQNSLTSANGLQIMCLQTSWIRQLFKIISRFCSWMCLSFKTLTPSVA